jgi:3-methylcrotonyl-CoA carboxylase alpha subunit
MFSKILIANRGEIACRVIKTARRLGVRTVAVFSEADAQARHTRLADEAVLIGPPPARESYLVIERIIAAAKQTHAEAIHPGYGFLSENEDFAAACAANGIVFIGPPVGAIRAMGSKSAAKALMEGAPVPLVPGYHGKEQAAKFLQKEADRIGYPVLLKPSAGGGGKGMRVVNAAGEFAEALASCKREATSSFGDDQVLVEKYVTRPRHVEIQVFADTHGNCLHLFERDCSVQRRHQKVLEEAPAPGMTPQRRQAMGEAAVAAARAVGYVGAGTVEFIADQAGQFYFMEMNTRLQVEHPVTEMITGIDLIREQVRIAAGEALGYRQDDIRVNGHALECRVNAEDPTTFAPSAGRVTAWLPPGGFGVRVDSHLMAPYVVPPFYDSLLAKIVVHGRDRAEAIARMRRALAETVVEGVKTTIPFHLKVLADPAFVAGGFTSVDGARLTGA